MVVVELTAPAYDEATHTATYQAKLLADYQKLGITFQEVPKGADEVPARFGPASLFIDDCPYGVIDCYVGPSSGGGAFAGNLGTKGFCYDWAGACCSPCESSDQSYWQTICNQTYETCNENCYAYVAGEARTCWGSSCPGGNCEG